MYFSRNHKQTHVTVDEAAGTAKIETFNAHMLPILREATKREEASCVCDVLGFGVYIVPKNTVEYIALETVKAVLAEEPFTSKQCSDKKIRRKYRKYARS